MGIDVFTRARDRMLAADRSARAVDEVLRDLVLSLHDVVEFHAAALLLTDPETMLPFGGIVEGLSDEGCVPFWDNELLDPDFLKFTEVARSSDPVAVLSDVTDGDVDRSPRFREQFRPLGACDELRVAFRTGESCWAVAFLLRPDEAGPYSAVDAAAVRDLVPVAARVIRSAVIRRDDQGSGGGMAMIVVDADGTIGATTPDAVVVLDDVATAGVGQSFATPVLAAALRVRNSRNATSVTVRARGSSGRWYRIVASPLGDDGRVAVMIEPARTADLIPIILESYGLTQRETEVVPLLARGLSTKQIAAEMCISRHTVGDYMKAIFDKCGVTTRGELVARIFTEQVLDHHKASTAHV